MFDFTIENAKNAFPTEPWIDEITQNTLKEMLLDSLIEPSENFLRII